MLVVEGVGQRVREVLVHDRVLREAAVVVPPREAGRDTQVLVAAPAEPAHSARVPQPRDPDSVTNAEARGTRGRRHRPCRRSRARGSRRPRAAADRLRRDADRSGTSRTRDTRTRISPGPGSGSRRSTRTSASGVRPIGPGRRTAHARTRRYLLSIAPRPAIMTTKPITRYATERATGACGRSVLSDVRRYPRTGLPGRLLATVRSITRCSVGAAPVQARARWRRTAPRPARTPTRATRCRRSCLPRGPRPQVTGTPSAQPARSRRATGASVSGVDVELHSGRDPLVGAGRARRRSSARRCRRRGSSRRVSCPIPGSSMPGTRPRSR